MDLHRRSLLAGAAALTAAGCATASPGPPAHGYDLLVDLDREPDAIIDLWPDGPPGGDDVTVIETIDERDNAFGLRDRAAVGVTRPILSLFRAREPDGSALLIAPGGGYRWVVVDKEGYEGARLFNRRGVTVYVLRNRLPHDGWAAGADAPLQDAQRAMRVIRARAGQDGVDPNRVAVLGFSAGGHLAGSLAQRFDAAVYAPVDAADTLSARPDLCALAYPVATMRDPHVHAGSREHLLGPAPTAERIAAYSLETAPPETTPPTFHFHAADDASVPVENSLGLFAALRSAGVAAELHVFDEGGHGFGLRGLEGKTARAWPELLLAFAARHGVVDTGALRA